MFVDTDLTIDFQALPSSLLLEQRDIVFEEVENPISMEMQTVEKTENNSKKPMRCINCY